MIAAGAFIGAYATVYGYPFLQWFSNYAERTALFTLIAGVSYYLFSVHRGSWRYVSIPELLAVIKASFFAVATYTVIYFLISRGADVPRSVPILLVVYLIFGLSAARLGYRLLVERRLVSPFRRGASAPEPRYVLLVGMTPEAESFVRSTKRLPDTPVEVLGIIDDTQSNTAQTVHGVKVHRGLGRLPRIIRSSASAGLKVSELIVAEPNASPQRLNTIMEAGSNVGLRVSRVPSLTRTASITTASLLESKPIEIGDLLGRPEIRTDVEGVARLVQDQVVLVTGAAGSIGSELCRQIATFRPKMMVIADNSEFQLYELDKRLRQSVPTLSIATRIVDVRDAARVSSVTREFLPDIVFHAAALKHVPLVEENPLEGIKTNVFGTRNVANAALENKVSTFVMISTDKAVNPTNLMGASKRAAEVYCQTLDLTSKTTCFKTVRFGNVLGSNGSVVPRFQEQIAAGGPVTVTHPDIERFFMT
ncbi:MAG: SDR family NAD(P)-dependent oxidoreductase, partial [Rhizobiaceae bacterium]